jgi:hypothetical protein
MLVLSIRPDKDEDDLVFKVAAHDEAQTFTVRIIPHPLHSNQVKVIIDAPLSISVHRRSVLESDRTTGS